VFVVIILILVYTNLLTNHLSPSQLEISPVSGSIDMVNQSNQLITLRFTRPMDPQCRRSSLYHDAGQLHEEVQRSIRWVDDQTLTIQLTRPLYQGEKLKIVLDGIFDYEKRPLGSPIVLTYEN
jgi:hypothetical protein